MIYSDFILEASKVLRTSRVEVERIIVTAPYRYKHYTIPKRNGGIRDIHHPTPALKVLQRWVLSRVFKSIPVHDSVFSYRHGKNIGMHAAMHLESNYVTRFDFADFFPSINAKVLRLFLLHEVMKGRVELDRQTLDAVVKICCCYKKSSGRFEVSIGAPSSPFISNAILYKFDLRMAGAASARRCVYTRYADDIYISGRDRGSVQELEREFFLFVAEDLPYLRINERKTQQLSRKRRVSVTGVNITPERKLSVGRDLKRSMTTQLFLALRGELEADDVLKLKGMLAHVKSVEPSFISKLVRKFGPLEVERFMKFPYGKLDEIEN